MHSLKEKSIHGTLSQVVCLPQRVISSSIISSFSDLPTPVLTQRDHGLQLHYQ